MSRLRYWLEFSQLFVWTMIRAAWYARNPIDILEEDRQELLNDIRRTNRRLEVARRERWRLDRELEHLNKQVEKYREQPLP